MEQHIDTGIRCLVAHYKENSQEILPQCIRCSCGQYIRPEDWDKHKIENNKLNE